MSIPYDILARRDLFLAPDSAQILVKIRVLGNAFIRTMCANVFMSEHSCKRAGLLAILKIHIFLQNLFETEEN